MSMFFFLLLAQKKETKKRIFEVPGGAVFFVYVIQMSNIFIIDEKEGAGKLSHLPRQYILRIAITFTRFYGWRNMPITIQLNF